MKIIADENIPYVKEAFAKLGEVCCVAGRDLSSAQLSDADVLLVRSVTRVNPALLENTPVRFVGSATIGFDHVDIDYLSQRKIGFARAPGSNATSAAEYILSALLLMSERLGFRLQDKTVGIIGCGNVGRRVLQRLQALGVSCLVNDPPKQEHDMLHDYVDLNTLLDTADIVTLHIPLEKNGAHPTLNLANQAFFQAMRDDGLFINTSRGAVVDEVALQEKMQLPDFHVILDVWKNEPAVDLELLQQVDLGTAHIAGYSFDGKVRGTQMLYEAVCKYFELNYKWLVELPPPALSSLEFSISASNEDILRSAILACYDIRRDDALLRLSSQQSNAAAYFDQLRKNYPCRREFSCLKLILAQQPDESLQKWLNVLGFEYSVR